MQFHGLGLLLDKGAKSESRGVGLQSALQEDGLCVHPGRVGTFAAVRKEGVASGGVRDVEVDRHESVGRRTGERFAGSQDSQVLAETNRDLAGAGDDTACVVQLSLAGGRSSRRGYTTSEREKRRQRRSA